MLEEGRLMEQSKELSDYGQMIQLFWPAFLDLFQAVKKQALTSGRREIDVAAEYIEEHYAPASHSGNSSRSGPYEPLLLQQLF